jgi:hypothetical protein
MIRCLSPPEIRRNLSKKNNSSLWLPERRRICRNIRWLFDWVSVCVEILKVDKINSEMYYEARATKLWLLFSSHRFVVSQSKD